MDAQLQQLMEEYALVLRLTAHLQLEITHLSVELPDGRHVVFQ